MNIKIKQPSVIDVLEQQGIIEKTKNQKLGEEERFEKSVARHYSEIKKRYPIRKNKVRR